MERIFLALLLHRGLIIFGDDYYLFISGDFALEEALSSVSEILTALCGADLSAAFFMPQFKTRAHCAFQERFFFSLH